MQLYREAYGWYPHGRPMREKGSVAAQRSLDAIFPQCEAKRGRRCPWCPECTRWRGIEWPDVAAEEIPLLQMIDGIYAEVNSGDMRHASKQAREALVWQRLTDPPPYELVCWAYPPKQPSSLDPCGLLRGVVGLFTSIWRSVFGD